MSNFKRAPRQEPRNPRDRVHGPRTNNAVNRNSGPFNSNSSQNRMMNPWEGGVAPGVVNHIVSRPSGGLLPTPTLPNPVSGLLQQFSTQDVQLAYASNVLSALLPGLQSHQSNQVPSLLSLNTNRGGLLPLSFVGQGPRENAGHNRPRPVAKPRPQPYNKMGNRNQRPGQKKEAHKGAYAPSSSVGRSADAVPKYNPSQDKKIKVEAEDSKKGRIERKIDSPSKNKMQEEKNLKDKEKEADAEKSKAAFSDVPSDMFYCHICSKHMWDAFSFSNHVKGRAHQMMMDEREKSYRIKIELMRHEMKVDEQQRQIALERKQRQGKSIGSQAREYCTMCDLNFAGSLAMHRKNNLHQELKSFLHPKCEDCSKEFATRLEWDQHLLTATHLKVSALNKSKKQNRGGGGSDILKTENDSSKDNVKNDNLKPKTEESVDKGKIDECITPTQIMTSQVNEKKEDSSSTILLGKEDKMLEYDPQKEVGKEMLQEKTGYLCRCCNRFLSSSADASTHCRSQFHFDKYLIFLKNKTVIHGSKPESNPESKTTKSEKSPDKCQEEREKDDDDEEDGNWKRRKIVKEDESNYKHSDVPKGNGEDSSTANVFGGAQETASSQDVKDDNQEVNDVPETSSLDKREEMQDVPDDADKTDEKEEKQSPPKLRRGRGGTASRSRGRKRK